MDLSKLRKIFGERLATSEAIRRQHRHDESWHVLLSLLVAVIFPKNEKGNFINIMYQIKRSIDPNNIMNPGKIF